MSNKDNLVVEVMKEYGKLARLFDIKIDLKSSYEFGKMYSSHYNLTSTMVDVSQKDAFKVVFSNSFAVYLSAHLQSMYNVNYKSNALLVAYGSSYKGGYQILNNKEDVENYLVFLQGRFTDMYKRLNHRLNKDGGANKDVFNRLLKSLSSISLVIPKNHWIVSEDIALHVREFVTSMYIQFHRSLASVASSYGFEAERRGENGGAKVLSSKYFSDIVSASSDLYYEFRDNPNKNYEDIKLSLPTFRNTSVKMSFFHQFLQEHYIKDILNGVAKPLRVSVKLGMDYNRDEADFQDLDVDMYNFRFKYFGSPNDSTVGNNTEVFLGSLKFDGSFDSLKDYVSKSGSSNLITLVKFLEAVNILSHGVYGGSMSNNNLYSNGSFKLTNLSSYKIKR